MTAAPPPSKRDALLHLLLDPATQLAVYREVRAKFPGVKMLCAATASAWLIRAGILSAYHPWTAELEEAVQSKGWRYVTPAPRPEDRVASRQSLVDSHEQPTASDYRLSTSDYGLLLPADLCYSVDANGNGAPDHVFFFLRWLDQARAVALVLDNYSARPHARNLGAPCWYGLRRLAYGALSFAQRCAG